MNWFLIVALLTTVPCEIRADAAPPSLSAAIQWDSAALQGVRDAKLDAPVVARALAIVHTCMYDAWVAYDEHAVGTQLGGALRRPAHERTLANEEQAIRLGSPSSCYRAADLAGRLLAKLIMPVLFSHRSREELARSKYASVIQGYARTVWTVMLFLYILSFIAGLITLVLFREAIPLQYAIIALGVNLLLILLFSRALFGTSESKPKN
jgi:hypothetical protein